MQWFVRRRDRGQTLVEFALILPIFVLVLVGILDLGRAVYAFNTMNNAAREGARLAIVDQTVTHIQDFAAQQTGWLGVDPSAVTVDFRDPADTATPSSCPATPGQQGSVGCLAVVKVEYVYEAATPLISAIVGPISIAGESRFRIESSCAEPTDASCPVGD